jgi:hypothetical protein
MSEADDAGSPSREPWLLAVFGGLIGIALAVALVVFGGLGGSGTASASSSPTALVSPSGSLTAEASPSTAPTDSLTPTLAPPTAAPAAARTAAPPKAPTPTPTPNTRPAITTFSIPSVVDCTVLAPTIHIAWTIRNATGVTLSIDGGGLYQSYAGTSGRDDVPFGCSKNVPAHTYTLRTTGGSGPAATITKSVKWGAMQIVSFTMSATANCPNFNKGTTVGVNLNFEVKYATGAELKRDDILYSTYSTKVVHTTGITYDCTQHDQEFRLTTTGGYGTPATRTFLVKNALG